MLFLRLYPESFGRRKEIAFHLSSFQIGYLIKAFIQVTQAEELALLCVLRAKNTRGESPTSKEQIDELIKMPKKHSTLAEVQEMYSI